MSIPENLPRQGSRDIGEGLIVSCYPDWCKSPDKPVPYDIYAYQDEDANTAPTVRMTKKRAHTKESFTTCSHGDEPGVGLGVKSGTRGSVCQPKTWSETVMIEGKNAVRDTDEWWMNNKNTTGRLCYVKNMEIPEPTPHYAKDGCAEQPDNGEETLAAYVRRAFGPAPEEPSVQVAAMGAAIGSGSGGVLQNPTSMGPLSKPREFHVNPTFSRFARVNLGVKVFIEILEDRARKVLPQELEAAGQRIAAGINKSYLYLTNRTISDAQRAEIQSIYEADLDAIYHGQVNTELIDRADKLLLDTYGQNVSILDLSEESVGKLITQEILMADKAATITEGNVRVDGETKASELEKACDEICMYACECRQDRGSHSTLTACVAEKMRDKHYDPDSGQHPQGGQKRPKGNGARPEVNYKKDGNDVYQPVQSRTEPQHPSNSPVIKDAPRPDISWWKDGKLWKLFEMKFGGDKPTKMQGEKLYEKIAKDQGLNPKEDLIQIDVDKDCTCSQNQDGKAIGRVKPGVNKCK